MMVMLVFLGVVCSLEEGGTCKIENIARSFLHRDHHKRIE